MNAYIALACLMAVLGLSQGGRPPYGHVGIGPTVPVPGSRNLEIGKLVIDKYAGRRQYGWYGDDHHHRDDHHHWNDDRHDRHDHDGWRDYGEHLKPSGTLVL